MKKTTITLDNGYEYTVLTPEKKDVDKKMDLKDEIILELHNKLEKSKPIPMVSDFNSSALPADVMNFLWRSSTYFDFGITSGKADLKKDISRLVREYERKYLSR